MLEPQSIAGDDGQQTGGGTRARKTLAERFGSVRAASVALVAPLSTEDTVVQSMPQASPAKWHLAHTTWFFEQFVLGRDAGYAAFNTQWQFLFNSYYQSVGPMHERTQRGLLSRPTLDETLEYRRTIDSRMNERLLRDVAPEVAELVVLGLEHEQQHQELLLTDVKHLFSLNPLEPIYRAQSSRAETASVPLQFIGGAEGIIELGSTASGFAFDCETPRHRALLHPHALANRLVSNAEYLAFIRDGGYRTPTLWMAEGWDLVCAERWTHPLYCSDGLDSEFTLGGRVAIDAHAPVSHISFYEADAFARWAGARLPSESEWESLASTQPVAGNFVESGLLHPCGADARIGPQQLFGDVWEWTASPYVNYPGYRPPAGALGEYNGKFMCGQYVLRGGSCVTPREHVRATYRNFFAPPERWQFMGLRLAKDL